MNRCPGCGADYSRGEPDCTARYHQLLALDHSRQEPWGSRHALMMACFALQHPAEWQRDVLERGWLLLHQVLIRRADYRKVTAALRRDPTIGPADWDTPPLPPAPVASRFGVTIKELGDFEAQSYPERLESWCRATLAGWGGPVLPARPVE